MNLCSATATDKEDVDYIIVNFFISTLLVKRIRYAKTQPNFLEEAYKIMACQYLPAAFKEFEK